MALNVALYLRVSTTGDRQTVENQELDLRAVAVRHGWDVVAVYADRISGTKAERPGLRKLLKSVARKEVDVVAAWAIDRLGRSLQHLLAVLSEINGKGVRPIPAPAGARHQDTGGQGHVPDARRVRGVRTLDDRRTRARWATQGTGAGHDAGAPTGRGSARGPGARRPECRTERACDRTCPRGRARDRATHQGPGRLARHVALERSALEARRGFVSKKRTMGPPGRGASRLPLHDQAYLNFFDSRSFPHG